MKAYIASPFFNPEQVERVKFIETTLGKVGIEMFSPRLDTYVKPDSSHSERRIAFHENLKGITNADFIVVVTDGKDVGTIFEAGYACAANIPILYFAETLGDKPFNLMLAHSATLGTCKTRTELYHALTDVATLGVVNCINRPEYKGLIE